MFVGNFSGSWSTTVWTDWADLLPVSTEQYDWKARAAISEAAAEEKRLAQPPHENRNELRLGHALYSSSRSNLIRAKAQAFCDTESRWHLQTCRLVPGWLESDYNRPPW